MAIIFTHIVDAINKRKFRLHDIPNSYSPMSEYFLYGNSIGPIHQPMNDEAGSGNYTISQMIDMFESGVVFTLSYPQDLFDIVELLDSYLKYLGDDTSFDVENRNKVDHCRSLRDHLHSKLPKAAYLSSKPFDAAKFNRELHLKRLGLV